MSPTSRATPRSRLFNDTSNTATRGKEAIATRTGPDGGSLDGRGVSVAVIDSGVDPTHPYFAEADGGSAVVANLKTICVPATTVCSVQRVPDFLDTDTTAGGGHGTHVSGIVAGRPTIEAALKVSAHKFTDGAAYEPGPLGTTSYDKGYGLVDVVAAVDALK